MFELKVMGLRIHVNEKLEWITGEFKLTLTLITINFKFLIQLSTHNFILFLIKFGECESVAKKTILDPEILSYHLKIPAPAQTAPSLRHKSKHIIACLADQNVNFSTFNIFIYVKSSTFYFRRVSWKTDRIFLTNAYYWYFNPKMSPYYWR